jgi:hypothetical protein
MTEEELKIKVKATQEEVRLLKSKYDFQVTELKEEVAFLKEKLMAQQDMLKIAIDYANKLGKDLKVLRKRIDSGNFQSIH